MPAARAAWMSRTSSPTYTVSMGAIAIEAAACSRGSGKGFGRAQVSPPTSTAEREPRPRDSRMGRAKRSNLLVTTPQTMPSASTRSSNWAMPGKRADSMHRLSA